MAFFAKAPCRAVAGLEGVRVEVEVGILSALPSLPFDGLADAAALEANERVRAPTICRSGCVFPRNRITVNLAPAEKKGPSLWTSDTRPGGQEPALRTCRGIEITSDLQSYTLRFPFQLGPGQSVSGFPEGTEHGIDGLVWKFDVRHPYHVLKISGFRSEEEAQAYASRFWAGLMWTLLNRGIAFDATQALGEVKYLPDPIAAADNLESSLGIPNRGPIHGYFIDDDVPAVYPSDKRILVTRVGNVALHFTTPFEDVLALILEGMSIRNRPAIDPKLQTALDLYAAYWNEHTPKAKLLTLVMALECLMVHPLRHAVVVELLDRWREEEAVAKSRFKQGSEEYVALESLEQELLFKKTDSLRSQVRTLVHETLTLAEHGQASELAQKAVKVYDRRSELVHKGYLPARVLNTATADAKQIVEAVLRAKFRAGQ